VDTLGDIEREIRWRRKMDGGPPRRAGAWLIAGLLAGIAWLVIWLVR